MWGGGGGGVSEEKQRNWVGGREKIKFQKKLRLGKKNWEGGSEKIELQKKTEIRADQGKKRSQPGMAR